MDCIESAVPVGIRPYSKLVLVRVPEQSMSFARILDSHSAMQVFVAATFTTYSAIPFLIYSFALQDEYFRDLSLVALTSCVAMEIGYFMPLFDSRFRTRARRIQINSGWFHIVVWSSFLLFLVVTFATAEHVPILSAISGASRAELDAQRGAFLKTRTGLEAALPYLGTFFVTALPYSLVHLFIEKSRLRFLLLAIFLAYSVSFLVKSLFVNALLPLLYLKAKQGKLTSIRLFGFAALVFCLLYVISVIAQADSASAEDFGDQSIAEFFKKTYKSSGVVDFLMWRIVAVPVFTAADTLRVFAERLSGEPLWGATSSLLAAIFSLERVPLEQLVYADQFGFNELANANAVFFTEAFANFYWPGVICFSLFVGQSLRWFNKSNDAGIQAIWMNYCFTLFTGGLIGTMLSNGYALILLFSLFCSLQERVPRSAARRLKNGN